MKTTIACGLAMLAAALLSYASPAAAQATRTWISGVGDDVNPCSRTAPCKTFAGAMPKTASGGEINCLDAGGFGAVTITKPITIDCSQTMGAILAGSGSSGVVINLPSGVAGVVTLRGLSINGAGSATEAIRVIGGGKSIHVENVAIRGFTGHGIEFRPISNTDLYVRGVQIDDVGSGGVHVGPGTGASSAASIDQSRFDSDGPYAVQVNDGGFATISKSVASRNTNGFQVFTTATSGTIVVYDSVANSNFGTGLSASGPNSAIYMSNVVLTQNSTADISGNVQTWVNNYSIANGGSNPTTGNVTPK
jgi:hypothetical protein